jgi:O-antigen/teichoic acid export membrane protein
MYTGNFRGILLLNNKPVGNSFTRNIFSDHFAAANIVMLAATAASNIFLYGYQLAMGIMLSAADYGTLLSLISIFVIVGVLTQTLSAVVAKTTAAFSADNRQDLIGRFYRVSLKYSFLAGMIVFAVLAVLSPLIARFLNLGNSGYVILTFSSFLFVFPLASNWGILQGLERFMALGSSQAIFALLRVLFGVLLVAAGAGITGGIAALPLSYLLVLGASLFLLKDRRASSRERVPFTGMGQYTMLTLVAFIAVSILTNIDVVIARHFLSPDEAGSYAAVSVLGRIVFYAPAGIGAVLFPKAARAVQRGEDAARYFRLSLLLTVAIVGAICLVYGLFPVQVMQFVFSDRFPAASPYLFKYGAAIALLSLSYLAVTYALSTGKMLISYAILSVAAVQVILLFIFHRTIADFVSVMLVSGGLAVTAIFVWLYSISRRKRPVSR